MKQFIAAMVFFWPLAGISDLSDEDPDQLCKLLEPYGIILTDYEVLEGELNPICFVKSQPTSGMDDGYEFSYRVISHFKKNHPDKLFLEVSGVPSRILGQQPHAQYVEMASVVLSSVYSEEVVGEILLAIESISPGFNRHMVVEGMNIQLRALDYSQRVAGMSWLVIRFDVSNACGLDGHADLQAKCIAKRKGSLAEK